MDYAGQDTFPSSLELLADNTGRDASSTNVSLEALADRTVWLKNRSAATHYVRSFYNPLALATFNGTNFTQSNIARTLTGSKAGDRLSIDLVANLEYVGTTGNWGNLRVAVIERYDTPNPTTFYPEGTIMIMGATGSSTYAAGASLIAEHPLQSDGNVRVVVEGRTQASATAVLMIVGSIALRVLKHRE
ncbi:hypothetical protein [Chondromyces crocatus]|uniref:Uncharacterized protein n=1 Tax=Chondromyces crocatus TaxID=52 RepID=A0A0K1EBI5_CHOCO|nr:hypothetical protein [Chondromyces crocatus]AKT38246.1 uncharacterized protein CMC5_023890 [Chondromyces crocatus]